MRILLLALLACWSVVLVGQSETINKVSGNHQNESLATILNYLDQNYPLDFYYKKEWLPTTPITLKYEDESVSSVLEKLFQNTNLGFSSFDDFAYILAPKEALGKEYSADYFTAKYQVVEEEIEENTSQLPIIIGSPENVATSGKGTISGIIKAKNGNNIRNGIIFKQKHNFFSQYISELGHKGT